ncbi:Hypp1312 [Branchiostoma lanceolatum]|uniref:Hypp1312 protein n=1 Tax=Branchiostoma lanceolatum TaxID=7740 RepID=A0A8K0EMG9_BRALA|nr:Hypp1312 [Branchiostoma lanceolatum]
MDNWTGSPGYNHSINDQEDDFLASSMAAKVLLVCWLVPSLVLILGLNVIFILAVARSPSLQKPRFLLPGNLAILDILLALVFIPNSINNIVGQKTVTTSVLNRLAQLVYLTVPCFSNPMIYGFRGEEVRAAIRTLLRRRGRTNNTDLVRGHRVTNQDTTRHLQTQLEAVSPESDVPAPQGQTRLSQRPTEPETPLEIPSDSDDDEQIAKTVVVKAIIEKRDPFKLQDSNEDHDSIDIELPGYVSSPL